MEHIQSQEQGDIPIPISVPPLNTSYVHAPSSSAAAGGGGGGSHHIGHAHHHHHHPTIIPQHPYPLHNHLLIPHHHHHHPQLPHSTAALDDPSPTTTPTTAAQTPPPLPYKKPPARYRECLKNHAASMGGNAMDGCGEFMPSGEEGTIEALTCSACGCHRNFHRKEVEGEASMDYLGLASRMGARKLILAPPHHRHHHQQQQSPRNVIPGQIIVHPHHQILQSESDEQEEHTPGAGQRYPDPRQQHHHGSHQGQQMGGGKKRYRTKFTQEQKEKMLEFAERAGWKIQKQEESVVQRFCQEVGVKRRVLKVWMHNNKHNLATKASLGDQQPEHGNGISPSSSPHHHHPPLPPPPPPLHMSHNSHPGMN